MPVETMGFGGQGTEEREVAARTIQRQWRLARWSPRFALCERVQLGGLAAFVHGWAPSDPGACHLRLEMRRKSFQVDLAKTRCRLAHDPHAYAVDCYPNTHTDAASGLDLAELRREHRATAPTRAQKLRKAADLAAASEGTAGTDFARRLDAKASKAKWRERRVKDSGGKGRRKQRGGKGRAKLAADVGSLPLQRNNTSMHDASPSAGSPAGDMHTQFCSTCGTVATDQGLSVRECGSCPRRHGQALIDWIAASEGRHLRWDDDLGDGEYLDLPGENDPVFAYFVNTSLTGVLGLPQCVAGFPQFAAEGYTWSAAERRVMCIRNLTSAEITDTIQGIILERRAYGYPHDPTNTGLEHWVDHRALNPGHYFKVGRALFIDKDEAWEDAKSRGQRHGRKTCVQAHARHRGVRQGRASRRSTVERGDAAGQNESGWKGGRRCRARGARAQKRRQLCM